MIRALLILSVLVAPGFAAEVQEDPLDRRVLDISKDLRCAVCQNQPISESNADLARDMRQIIREQLQAGKTREEIIGYFVARYGDYVLLKPPHDGPGAIVWILPLILVAVLAVSAVGYLWRRLHTPLPPPPALSQADVERVRRARADADQNRRE